MSVTADVTKRGRTIRENVQVTIPSSEQVTTEARKPLFAYLGVVDLAVERAKSRTPELAKLPATVQAQVKQLPTLVLALPATVKSRVETLQDKGTALYGDLAERGEKLVTSIRRQPSTQAAEKATDQVVRSAKATATSAKKAVRATSKAADAAADKVG